MSEKISEYITSVTALASGDLMDVSKLISTSPLEYQSQKLNYSVLLTELNADLSITLQSIYNASTQPQILTSVAKGGVVIRSGQALDTNSVLELKNIAGSSTFVVGGNGVVATGNWQATAIAAAFGGTGQTSYTIGDLIYASNTTAIAKLGIGTSGQVLTVSGGGIPSWAAVSASNLGSANLTSTDDARTFTLKTGTTATQNLQILNSAGANLFTGRGDNKVVFGSSSIGLSIDKYLNNSVTTDTYINNVLFNRIQTNQRGELWYNASGNAKIQISGTGEISLFGALTEYNIYNASNNRAAILACSNANTGQLWILNSSGVTKTIIEVGYSVFDSLMKIGGSYGVATAQLQVVGSGSTSETKTALFQNSGSVSALTIKDDLYCIFRAKNAVIPDADLGNNEMSFYIEEATNDLHFKVKYSTGTVKSGKINLT
jgi:hypothetical protein